jgi:hypothetical protein
VEVSVNDSLRSEQTEREHETILIMGDELPHDEGNATVLLGGRRIPIEAIRRNLSVVIEQVGDLVRTAQESIGSVAIAHIDVQLSIAVDGSVGLLGSGASASAGGTLKVRLVAEQSAV